MRPTGQALRLETPMRREPTNLYCPGMQYIVALITYVTGIRFIGNRHNPSYDVRLSRRG